MSSFLLDGVEEALAKLALPDDHRILLVQYRRKKVGKKWKGGDTQLFITGTAEEYESDDPTLTAEAELREETRLEPLHMVHLHRADKVLAPKKPKSRVAESDVKVASDPVPQEGHVPLDQQGISGISCADTKTVMAPSPAPEPDIKMVPVPDVNTVHSDWFGIHARDLQYIGQVPLRPETKTKVRHKVACIVHGTEAEMTRLLTEYPASIPGPGKVRTKISAGYEVGKPEGNDSLEALVTMSVADVNAVIATIRQRRRERRPRDPNNPYDAFTWKAPSRWSWWSCCR